MVDMVVSKSELIDAQKDAQALDDVVNGPAEVQVYTRLGRYIWTIATLEQRSLLKIAQWQDAISMVTAGSGTPALAISDASGKNQQQINDELRYDSGIYTWSGRTQEEKNKEVVSPLDFGCVSGIESTVKLQAFFNHVAANKCTGDLLKGCSWVFKNINVPNGIKLIGNSVLRHDGSGNRATGSDTLITFNGDEDIECLHISTPATENIYYLAHFNGNNHSIKTLKITADSLHIAPSYSEGVRMYGDNIDIGLFESKNHRRPLQIYNPNLATVWNKNIKIGVMICDQYIRGLNISGYDSVNIGTLKVTGQHPGANAQPGHNGILFGAVKNVSIDTLWIEDSMEHSVRFGGDTFDTEDITINRIIVKRSNQCAFKAATTPPTKIKNLNIGSIFALDCGRGQDLGNTELVRITSYEDVNIGKIVGRHTSAYTQSTRTALVHNSGSGLSVDLIDVTDVSARIVQVYGDNDMGTESVLNTRFGMIKGNLITASSRYAIGIYLPRNTGAPTRSLGNYIVEDTDLSGFSVGLITGEDEKFFNASGVIHIKAKTSGSVAPATDLLTTTQLSNPASLFLDLTHNGNRFVGGGTVDFNANFSLKPKTLTENILKLLSVPSGDLIGNKVVFSRPSGDRVGAGFAVKQGSSVARCGLTFFTTNSATSANENLIESMELKPNGVLSLKSPQVFASNAAAVTGGLVSGDIYWTATGEIRIVI